MDYSFITDYWQIDDLFKASLSLIVGMLLGAERELKDKAAGLRTITLICLGSTLFTVLSYKLGSGTSEDATRIASYIVSGIGFLGAGVIFKDAFTVNGLTTASIIWVAAAIGMSIGFGQYYTALTFLIFSFLIIYLGGLINKRFLDKVVLKHVEIQLDKFSYADKLIIEKDMYQFCKHIDVRQIQQKNNVLILIYDCKVFKHKINDLEVYLVNTSNIQGFKM
ncbi:MgtC/SapB family protein [Myroides sp. JBRI-B21084]|uniref:MgtC/SapB family protein n=1 Tax=Myroides sp. JBRI-B21084 TaxID=3119977 RepID=UPI0026E48055|nr:MgtC/SapB family protein [Paenimyroides cloacae]WKW46534.1 MgtC/SapB family protein [Paenimyroides cloacae]